MRKLVKPADALARIPDPVRGGYLPPEGRVVDWSVHWARYAQRGDVVATEPEDEKPAPTAGEGEPGPAEDEGGKPSEPIAAEGAPTDPAPSEPAPAETASSPSPAARRPRS